MPINVEHRMPGADVAGAGYVSGLGQFQKFLAQRQLQYDQMANQRGMQQQALGAQLFGQQQNLQAQLARDFAQQRFQGQRDVFAANQQADRDDQKAANDAEWRNAQLKMQENRLGQQGDLGAAQEERMWAKGTMDSIQEARKNGFDINQLEYNKAYADYQNILKDNSLSRDERKFAALEQRRKIDGIVMSAKPSMDGPPLTKEHRLNENVVTVPVNPDLPESGKAVWIQQPSRNGQPPTYKFNHFEFPDGTISKDGVHPRQAALDKQAAAQTTAMDKLFNDLLTTQVDSGPEGGKRDRTPEEIAERMRLAKDYMNGVTPPPPTPVQAPPPDTSASWTESTPEGRAMKAAIQKQAQGRPQQQPTADPQLDAMAAEVLPHPKSPEEARLLPPGTWFITPDGRKMKVPQK